MVIPAYRSVREQLNLSRALAKITIHGHDIEIYSTKFPDTDVRLLLIDAPPLFDFDGNPYVDQTGHARENNAQKFGLFCRAIALVATDQANLYWRPDVLHCNDWQTGLALTFLEDQTDRPATVFTIHNLAYQGNFPYQSFLELGLSDAHWDYTKLEFHNQLSFIKGGIVFADQVNTVSPTYANEIQTSEFGCGLELLLQHYSSKLSGILNGIHEEKWNPETDSYIDKNYNSNTINKKLINKTALQKLFGLECKPDVPVFALVSRLVSQKGLDYIIDIAPNFKFFNLQFIIFGSGDAGIEKNLLDLASKYPSQIAVRIGFDEKLAHLCTAGADFFMMPSRFEPCGLNQMYSQRYGTIPVVNAVGGLQDSVIDVKSSNYAGTGIKEKLSSASDLLRAMVRALSLYADSEKFRLIQATAMQTDFSWEKSAQKYLGIYQRAMSSK
jgi:starch synthase